jgi:hypothetical protein
MWPNIGKPINFKFRLLNFIVSRFPKKEKKKKKKKKSLFHLQGQVKQEYVNVFSKIQAETLFEKIIWNSGC